MRGQGAGEGEVKGHQAPAGSFWLSHCSERRVHGTVSCTPIAVFFPQAVPVGVGRTWRLRWHREKRNASAKLLRNIGGRCRRANRDPGVGDHVSKVKEHTAHSRRQLIPETKTQRQQEETCWPLVPFWECDSLGIQKYSQKQLRETLGNVTESQGDLEQQGFKPRQGEIVGNYSKLANSPSPSLSQRPLSCVLFQLLVSLAGPGWPWIRTSDLRADSSASGDLDLRKHLSMSPTSNFPPALIQPG